MAVLSIITNAGLRSTDSEFSLRERRRHNRCLFSQDHSEALATPPPVNAIFIADMSVCIPSPSLPFSSLSRRLRNRPCSAGHLDPENCKPSEFYRGSLLAPTGAAKLRKGFTPFGRQVMLCLAVTLADGELRKYVPMSDLTVGIN